jgi:hypothetical protein
MLAGCVALAVTPETVRRPEQRRRYRPQRVTIPPASRATFYAAAAAVIAAVARKLVARPVRPLAAPGRLVTRTDRPATRTDRLVAIRSPTGRG